MSMHAPDYAAAAKRGLVVVQGLWDKYPRVACFAVGLLAGLFIGAVWL